MIKKLVGVTLSAVLTASLVSGAALSAVAVDAPDELKEETNAAQLAQTQEVPAAEPEGQAEEGYAAYLFVHFVDTEETADKEQIYFSVSKNGTDWTTLNDSKPVLRSNVGEKGVRDPHIVRTADNKFRIVATDLSIFNRHGEWGEAQTGGSRNIIVWKSDSLTDWGEGKAVPVGTPDALDVWAPESVWDVDKEQYMVTWASIVGDREAKICHDWKYRIYRSYTTDFETFTEPEVYMERQDDIIDTTFYYNEANKMYYRFTKDESNNKKWVFMEQGAHLDGDFEAVATYSLDGKHYSKTTGVEGPTVYKLNGEDKWCLLLDNWTYKPYETDDITKGVFKTAGEFTFNGPRFRHGSVIPITQREYDALLAKYPNPQPEEPDKTTGECIFDLGFENDAPKATVGDYVVTPSGTFTYEQGKNGQAARFSWDNQTSLKIDGSLLAGRKNVTLRFLVKIYDTSRTSWFFFAAKNDNQMQDPPTYIGNFFKDGGTIASERFLNGRLPDSYNTGVPGNEWLSVTVVYYQGSTKLFVGSSLKNDSGNRGTTTTTASLPEILGATPSIFLGKATWGGGEYANILLERFSVYDYAMPDEEVARLAASEM